MARTSRTTPEDEGGILPDLDPEDRKLLTSYLEKVEKELWNIGSDDRKTALEELRVHLLERYHRLGSEDSMEIAIYSTGGPDTVARGLRALYGYSNQIKVLFVLLTGLLGMATVPMLAPLGLGPVTIPTFGIWSPFFLVALFFVISNLGTKTGLAMGGLMGTSAALSRTILVLSMLYGAPPGTTLGTSYAVIDFVIVDLFLVLVGLFAGQIRRTSEELFMKIGNVQLNP